MRSMSLSPGRALLPALALGVLLVSACGYLPDAEVAGPSPSPAPATGPGSAESDVHDLAAAACLDGSGSYRPGLWQGTLKEIAGQAGGLVDLGSGGAVLWVFGIDDNSFDTESVLAVIRVPPLPSLPSPPDLESRPFEADRLRAAYQAKLQRLRQQVLKVQQQLETDLKGLTSVPFPNAQQTDIFGCLQAASDRLAAAEASRQILIVASDLEHASKRGHHESLRLDGVHVKISPWLCEDAETCGDHEAHWRGWFHDRGALSVTFTPPSEQVDLFAAPERRTAP